MRNSSKVITVVSVIIIIGLGYAYDDLTKPAYDSASTIQGEKTFELSGNVSIGVILPITGDLSSHGAENRDSIKLAINDFNEYLTTNTKNWKIVPVIEDSATNPTVAREKINRLYMEGIDIILGLEASENIRKIKQYVDDNNILIISCCSSSTSLAVDDSIFRLVPDDSNQGDALAKLLQHKGIETVVPIWRNDIWGNDLQIATTNSFKKLGGEMDPGYRYDPDSPESASMLFFDQQVSKYVQQPGDEDKVAVLFLGFGEIENIIKSVVKLENSTLGKVSWFGPGAITKEGRILNDKNSEFLQKINLTTVQFAVTKNPTFEYVNKTLTDELGIVPSTFSYSSYDTVWLLGLALLEANSTDVDAVKSAIPIIAANYSGAIGPTTLNENGDLKQANYDIWGVRDGEWKKLGNYTKATDSILMN